MVKVSQGNKARYGEAWVYHDHPTSDDGEMLSKVCDITPSSADDKTTVCKLTMDADFTKTLVDYDSLTIRVKTTKDPDGKAPGNFEAVSACVVIESAQ